MFFDIEADGDNVPTVVGLMDREGLATFRRGKSLERLPGAVGEQPAVGLVQWRGVRRAGAAGALRRAVSFSGGARRPALGAAGQAEGGPQGHREDAGPAAASAPRGRARAGRDSPVEGVEAYNRRQEALRILVEYNLYDAVNLRSVLEWTAWRVAELNAWSDVERARIFERGDVLYDLTRLVMAQ